MINLILCGGSGTRLWPKIKGYSKGGREMFSGIRGKKFDFSKIEDFFFASLSF